jgi:hypothetical protein
MTAKDFCDISVVRVLCISGSWTYMNNATTQYHNDECVSVNTLGLARTQFIFARVLKVLPEFYRIVFFIYFHMWQILDI